MSVTSFIILALAGLVIGILSGLLGIGGGTMIIPTLRLGHGLSALSSVGTSLFTIIPTSIASLIGHLRSHTVRIRLGIIIGVVGIPASILGSILCNHLGGTVVMLLAAAVIVYTAVSMFRRAAKDSHDDKPAAGPTPAMPVPHEVPKALGIGALAGCASGLIGLGGGFIIVPLSAWLLRLSMKEAAGTSALAILFIVIPGAVAHGMAGNVALLPGLALAIGSVPGALLGAWLCTRVPDRILRIIFGIMLLVAGMLLAAGEFGLLW